MGIPPYKKGKGDWQFFDVLCYGSSVESIEKIIHPKMEVVVTGYLKQNQWTSKDGQKKTSVSIICSKIDVTKWPPREGDAGEYDEEGNRGVEDDIIPF